MKTSSNNNNIESKNGMSQVINILTGETKKMRCHYLSKRNDKPVSRVLTLERLNHPALTAAGVTAWGERFNDDANSFDWLCVSIQLTDKICYTPNCANVGLPDVENYGNLDYYKNQEGAMRVYMNNVDKFFQSIAAKPAKMMKGEDWPNMAVIAAYKAAGRDQEAETLTAARDIYETRRESDKEAWRKKYAAQQTYHNSPKPENFDDLTELEKAQFMIETAQECVKNHPELDWADILEKAEKRLEKAEKERKAQEWQEFLDREAEKQNSFTEGMRVTVPAASLTDGEAFVIVTIRRKAADNGGNACLTVKNETTGDVRNINGSDVQDILPPLEPASEITAPSEQGIKAGTEVWTTIELHEEYGKRGKVVRRFFADHGVWCLDIKFEDGTKATYAEEYVTTEKPWAVVGAKCRHRYLDSDVVLTITAVGRYYGIKAESEDGKVKRCDLVSYFEPVEDETYFSDTLDGDLKEGDRVLSRHYGAQATVLGKEWDKQRKAWYYRVKFDTMQRHMDGSEFNVTEFHRDGLTKNYDPATGRERVGNAEYYRETLLAEFWGNDRTPRTVYGMEIFKPTDRRPSWLVVADIFSEPKEMTLREVCDMLAARYQEERGKAA